MCTFKISDWQGYFHELFSGTHFPKDVILHAVFFYLRYAVFYRD
jgi:putative transposase